ncbi:hypothetical protein JIN85_01960 [Luteolibacter pohnpeiensis]|uniref:Uncharacterized protein n=1 Tax=Luteolibacter pohnpeiensis TaxID=454153 RepID=A0A934S3D3_9BACT|nr:hypothetical protein [Luteolibacter pohnpeiensis]MBK1881158.1 hypothetical protein [Luteolibacter pohnpeiensis]
MSIIETEIEAGPATETAIEPQASSAGSTTRTPEVVLDDEWDTMAIARLIRSKSHYDETPAFLFLGKKEARLLSEHLASAFGEESVATLRDTYYMGLETIVLDTETHLSTGGRKALRTLQDPISRRPAWRDNDVDTRWQFRA